MTESSRKNGSPPIFQEVRNRQVRRTISVDDANLEAVIVPATSSSIAGALGGLGLIGKKKSVNYLVEIRHMIARFDARLENSLPNYSSEDGWKEATIRDKLDVIYWLTRTLAHYARATFHSYLDVADSEESPSNKALDGFLCLARVAAVLKMTSTKSECLGSLAIESGLLKRRGLIGPRNIAAAQKLLSFAFMHPEYTDDTWPIILVCASELDRMSIIQSRALVIRASLAAAMGQVTAHPPPNLTTFFGLLPPLWTRIRAGKKDKFQISSSPIDFRLVGK